jgi:hypothetical protein
MRLLHCLGDGSWRESPTSGTEGRYPEKRSRLGSNERDFRPNDPNSILQHSGLGTR